MTDVGDAAAAPATPQLTESASFTGRWRQGWRPPSMEADEFMALLHGSDTVKVELHRLESQVRAAVAAFFIFFSSLKCLLMQYWKIAFFWLNWSVWRMQLVLVDFWNFWISMSRLAKIQRFQVMSDINYPFDVVFVAMVVFFYLV